MQRSGAAGTARATTDDPGRWLRTAAVLCLPALVHPLVPDPLRPAWLVVAFAVPVASLWRSVGRGDLPNPGWRDLRDHVTLQAAAILCWQLGPEWGEQVMVVASLVALPLLVRAVRRLLRRPSGVDPTTTLDASIVAMAGLLLLWVALIGPGGRGPRRSTFDVATDVVGALLVVAVLTMLLRLLFRHRRPPGYEAVFTAGALAGAVLALVRLGQPPSIPLHDGPVGPPLLALAVASVAIAAAHPTARQGLVRTRAVQRPWAPARLALVVVSLLVPVGVRGTCLARPDVVDCGSGSVVLEAALLAAVAARIVVAVRQGQRHRRELDDQTHLHEALATHAADGVAVLEPDGRARFATPACSRLLGVDVMTTDPEQLVLPPDTGMVFDAFREAAARPGEPVVVTGRPRAVPTRWLEMRLTDLRHDPAIAGFVANVRDVTASREHAFALQQLAYEDHLTGLRNRAALLRHIDRCLQAGEPVTALFCDLDRLKLVNDTLGHAAGDRLLLEAAERFRRAVGGDGVVGRLGGDEFLVVRPTRDPEDALALAEQLREALAEPFSIMGRPISLSCSIGLVHGREGGTAESLVAEADLAMYRAKELGRDRVVVFDTMLRVEQERRHRTQLQLPTAIAAGQLAVRYQPIIRGSDLAPWGAEALVRWAHPEEGMLAPSTFIDVAEETGLIVPLGAAVLGQAVAAAVTNPSLPMVSVNIAQAQLEDEGFTEFLTDLLALHRVSPDRLVLELTERTLLTGSPTTVARLAHLRSLGVRIALDDFGTGYASFAALQSLPLDLLKVDQTLLPEPRGQGALLEAVLTMAHSLGLLVVVEGIERQDQLELSVQLGADLLQGYLLGAPAPLEELPTAPSHR